ncbi:MAG TPA: NADH-quinone oxidoreductase subunit M [Candidatus Competibacteraceae bacterium]|nr:NADH-quinone oxidoreductase subunit M [Candidatus Competibacteraceae bacterium]
MLQGIIALIPALPLAATVWIGLTILFGQTRGEAHEPRTSRIALTANVGSLVVTLALIAVRLMGWLPDQTTLGSWLTSGSYQIHLNFIADSLTLALLAITTLGCLLVTRFAVNYMHREAGFHRFFMLLSLFTAAMTVLVMAGNAVLTFIGWEIAGFCSYLLISFFQDRPVAAGNATRVFVANRVGDAGFLLGIALSFYWLGSVDWSMINAGAIGLNSGQISILAGCFLLAAIAKSAQVPLAPWLARAMEGPTPSSALFYGMVMVYAGVYLLLRLHPLFEQSPMVMAVMTLIGLATALYGFLTGLTQTDIKSALIFSTTGQLGLMFLACGLGFWRLTLIYLCCHAIFRGYQFFTAPSILRQLHGERTRPVSDALAQRRGIYTAALQRFWLDEVADALIVRPVQRLAGLMRHFDARVIDRATGLPAPAVNALSSVAQWEERQLGTGRTLERAPSAIDQEPGLVGRATEWAAATFHWVEERLMLKTAGQGLAILSQQLGRGLNRLERLMGRSWIGIAVAAALLATLAGVGGMMASGEPGPASTSFLLLSLLLAVPLTGMLAAFRTQQAHTAFALGLATATVELMLTIQLLSHFQPEIPGAQFVEQYEILPWLGIHLGIDGVSVLFLPLTALLTLFVLLYTQSHRQQQERPGVFVANLLALETVLIGMFTALNLLQFWLFALAEVLPATFLIARYGTSPARDQAARYFLHFMLGGLAALLAGILLLGWNHATVTHEGWSFAGSALLETPVAAGQQSLIFILLFAGLAVRLALFPFHAWLPIVARHGTVAIGIVFLVGVKVGVYALLRWVFPLLPEAAWQWDAGVIALGLTGMLYGALLAFRQHDLRRLLAFAVISQSGVLVAGLFSLNPAGLRGSLLLALNLGLAASGLFIVAGLLYRRLGTTRFHQLGGLFETAPLLGLTFLVVVLGSIAMPGTPGFEAAHLALEGLLETQGWGIATLAAVGNVLAAGYLLWAYQRIFLARYPRGAAPFFADLRHRELLMAGLLCAVMIGVGLYADPWIKRIGSAVDVTAHRLEAAIGADLSVPH